MNRMKTWLAMFSLCILGLWILAGCSKKENTNEEQTSSPTSESKPAPASAPIDSATAASVSGSVKLDGAAPKAAKIDMSQDAACKGANQSENIVADGGKLANVFVYVKGRPGRSDLSMFPKSRSVINQEGCRYHPHVLGVMTGQNVEIKNDDPTTHNIHPTPKDNREWNESQPPKAAPIEKTFAREEILLPVKCNQHPWMKMYVNVVKTPVLRRHRRRRQV